MTAPRERKLTMRLPITLAALLIASTASAQEMTWLERAAYVLSGGDQRGQVIIQSGNHQTDETREARGLGFGQNLDGSWHSRDRTAMAVRLTSVDRETKQRQGFVGAFVATIRDLGDQGAGSPARITLRSNGEVVDRIRIRGGATERWNGNVRRVSFSGPLHNATLTINTGAGRLRRGVRDPGAPGWGDGFSVKVRTADDCPPDEGPRMRMTTERRGTKAAASNARSGGKGKGARGGKSRGGKRR